uniref:Uncharacterized protein n=1 Tax=Candidatus Kentrum eta TaxID=2126337 RepID=A0A450V5B5_9GAMM|nr:MAG: hypothetical protein BECKH772B_GA0070898_1001829 [Candidatus Kentron sp. H]VFJ99959.1 MAG: hypothetical protein BECKH772A_GA0070896_1017710 [Candidatus Kentron sp. H]
MRADVEIEISALEILNRHLGMVETERFIALVQRERFDYTAWRQNLFAGVNGEEISRRAMEFRKESEHQSVGGRMNMNAYEITVMVMAIVATPPVLWLVWKNRKENRSLAPK